MLFQFNGQADRGCCPCTTLLDSIFRFPETFACEAAELESIARFAGANPPN